MDYIKSMGNYCRYGIATEGVGAAVGIAVAALIGASITKAAVKHKIDKSRMKKYDKEMASGNISDKIATNANKVKVHGIPYPKYAEAKSTVNKQYGSQVYQILIEAQTAMKTKLKQFCDKDEKYKPLYRIISTVDFTKEEVVDAILFKGTDIDLIYSLSADAIKFEIENAADNGYEDGADALKNLIGDEDINTIKELGLDITTIGIAKMEQIINAELSRAIQKIGMLKIPGSITPFHNDNPDDVSRVYGVTFKCNIL